MYETKKTATSIMTIIEGMVDFFGGLDSTNLQNIGLTGYKSTLSAINLTRLIDFYPP